jgi:hypothetical protein
MDEMRAAAQKRRDLYRARADRPSQRRSFVSHGGRPAAYFPAQMEMRLMGGGAISPAPGMVPTGGAWVSDESSPTDIDSIFFVGLASSTDSPYEMYDQCGPYTESVAKGAFQQSLSLGDQLDVPLVIEHNTIQRIARTTIPWGQPGALMLAETDLGLVCRAQLDPADIDVQYIMPKIASGLVSEMSFRFEITSGEWSPDFSQFVINSANLQRGDVSIVGYGANPNTFAGLSARAESATPKASRKFIVKDSDLR